MAAKQRLSDLRTLLDGLTGRLAGSAEATRKALGLFGTYCEVLDRRIQADWDQFDDETRVTLLRFYLRDIGTRLIELEEWFAGGADASVPPALVDAAAAECSEVLAAPRHVILAVGDPDNMATLIDELPELVFGGTELLEEEGVTLPDDRFALIQVSRFEANNPIWRPLVLGHEIAHLALLDLPIVTDFDMLSRLDSQRIEHLKDLPDQYEHLDGFPILAMVTVAEEWLEELVCDAYAIRRWGPAAVSALGAYFEQVGAGNAYGTHPPPWLRVRLMLRWLGPIEDPTLLEVLAPWSQVAEAGGPVDDDWAVYLVEFFEDIVDEILPLLSDWPQEYDFRASAQIVSDLAQDLAAGVPRVEVAEVGQFALATDADIVNAAWLARAGDHPTALYQLVEKALESADFLRRWGRNGGDIDPDLEDPQLPADFDAHGLLSESAIVQRLRSEDPDYRLVLTPLLPGAIKETSIDLRLGRHFIVFQRASTGAFDALKDDQGDPRTMQRAVERRWGDPFVLHPGELVLAATLEYMVLPRDLGAQVITRSSYGRLGLITATAIQIHPLFRGCLTLELVNLGALPISLYPCQRVAQLALSVAAPPLKEEPDKKYDYPTRPEFSRVREDKDAVILRNIGDV